MSLCLVLGSCTAVLDDTNPADSTEKLDFEYERIGEPGYMDQVLLITSTADQPLALSADLEALDSTGALLPRVKVDTVYGAEAGNLVIMPGANVDIMSFAGRDADRVRDVRVSVTDVNEIDITPAQAPVDATPLDSEGNELGSAVGFTEVALHNENDVDVAVRVTFIEWNDPAAGESQQALSATDVTGLVTVPAGGDVVVDVLPGRLSLTENPALRRVSLKPYISH